MKQFALLLLPVVLSGCMMWDAGYTDNKPVHCYEIPAGERLPVSYSVTVELARQDILAAPTQSSISEKVSEGLKESGMFSVVHALSHLDSEGYHVEIKHKQGGMTVEQSMGVGLLAGYTLLFVPVVEILTFDTTAILYLKGKPIYSTAKAEEMRCLIWWPMAPAGLFMNSYTVMNAIEKGNVRAVVNDIVQEHKRRYLSGVVVREIVGE